MKTQKQLANDERKKEFTLMGVIRYAKERSGPEFQKFLDLHGVKKSQITIDLLKTGYETNRFFNHSKTGEITTEKTVFTLWFIMGAIEAITTRKNEALKAKTKAANDLLKAEIKAKKEAAAAAKNQK